MSSANPPAETISWFPLATTFTPPGFCSTLFLGDGFLMTAFAPNGASVDGIQCQPPAVVSSWQAMHNSPVTAVENQSQSQPAASTTYGIAPLVCPHGWYTAHSVVIGTYTTQATCCPNVYTLSTGSSDLDPVWCTSSAAEGDLLTFTSLTESGGATTVAAVVQTVMGSSQYVLASPISGYNMRNVPSGQVYSSSNSIPKTPAPSVTSAPNSPSSTSSITSGITTAPSVTTGPKGTYMTMSSSTPAPTNGMPTALSKDSLSTGAKAGIGVGAAVGVVGIVAILLTLWMLMRRKHSLIPKEDITDTPSTAAFDEKRSTWSSGPFSERTSARYTNVSALSDPQEMEGYRDPVELDVQPGR